MFWISLAIDMLFLMEQFIASITTELNPVRDYMYIEKPHLKTVIVPLGTTCLFIFLLSAIIID